MAEVPRITVQVADLGGESPVAMYDSLKRVKVGIDFSAEPEEIVGALTRLFQEGVDSGRWTRNEHTRADVHDEGRAAPHPRDDSA